MASQKKVLGRGLGGIIGGGINRVAPAKSLKKDPPEDRSAISPHGLFSEIPIEKIKTSPYQARKTFAEEEISQLADSIAEAGLLQPILVRKIKDGYELLAGERRLRACTKIGLKKIVAYVQQAGDAAAAARGLIENLQRANLNPMEEARGYANLMANFHLTQEAVAQRVSKPRSTVANACRLLTLPAEIQGYISSGLLSMGHAKVILSDSDNDRRIILAREIIERNLNVRSAEEAAKRAKERIERNTPGTAASAAAKNAVIRDLEKRLSSKLKAKVELKHSPKHGKIIIEYFGNEDLQRILESMGMDF